MARYLCCSSANLPCSSALKRWHDSAKKRRGAAVCKSPRFRLPARTAKDGIGRSHRLT